MKTGVLNHGPRRLPPPALALLFVAALPLLSPAQRPAEVRLDDTAWVADMSVAGAYVFELRGGGVFRATSSEGVTRTGTWERRGSSVRIRVRGLSENYSGVLEGGRLEGTATGKAGRTWRWSARRQEATPVASSAVAPRYPSVAKASRAEGVVNVQVKVDEAGRVSGALPFSGHPLLQQAAAEAARRWRFNPEEGAGTRTAHLFFVFQISLPKGNDCRGIDPAPEQVSPYQFKVQAHLGCVEYSVSQRR